MNFGQKGTIGLVSNWFFNEKWALVANIIEFISLILALSKAVYTLILTISYILQLVANNEKEVTFC